MKETTLTLYELNGLVRELFETCITDTYWVTGELGDAGSPAYGGHFYGELIQKEGDHIVARARVTCWARTYGMLRFRFQQTTGEALRKGMQVKLLVKVTFHEQYGYALNILDIDAAFTLGDMAKRRREILAQLEADGILHDNQQLPLPRLLKRIAVISSPTAAGYGDFCNQMEQNEYGLAFSVKLFPSVMQGEGVPMGILAALEAILSSSEQFDLVVIIRGGGASGDLSDFDDYQLASAIAQFPIPVVTGIGHERDETVLDYVAHTRVKTPTAAAAFIISHQAQEAALLDDLYQRITHAARQRIVNEKQRLLRHQTVLPLLFTRFTERQQNRLALLAQRFASASRNRQEQGRTRLSLLAQRLATACTNRMERERHRQELIGQRLTSLDPRLLLKRGYSITTCAGKIVRDMDDLREGDVLTTSVEQGEIYSKVVLCKKN